MSNLVNLDMTTYEHIAIVSLNRPDAANAMSSQLLSELQEAVEDIENNDTIFCTILTAAGDRAFCAGADLKERRGLNERQVLQAVRKIGDTVLKVEHMSMPVIAAINGVAFGGGLELALGCDLRIASENVQLGLTETSLAIIPGAGGTQRLPRLIGIGQAKKLIYTSKRLTADEAQEYGIVEDVVPAGEVLEHAVSLAGEIVKNGPIALKQAKTAINRGTEVDLATGLEIEHLSYQGTLRTEDRLEGLQAFKEKRRPVYRGK